MAMQVKEGHMWRCIRKICICGLADVAMPCRQLCRRTVQDTVQKLRQALVQTDVVKDPARATSVTNRVGQEPKFERERWGQPAPGTAGDPGGREKEGGKEDARQEQQKKRNLNNGPGGILFCVFSFAAARAAHER